jgi:hypothetical protein
MRITLAALIGAAALVVPGTASALPGNDSFASATPIASLPFSESLDLDGATNEPGEQHFCSFQQQSVWYRYSPAAATGARIDINGSGFGVVATLWRDFGGGLGNLSFQGCFGVGGGITLAAEAGATYYVQTGSTSIGPAALTLNVQQVPPPPNDAFADARTVGPLPYEDSVDMLSATIEPGEDTSPPGVSTTFVGTAWYTFTAPSTGSTMATELGCCSQSGVGIYTGGSLDSLVHVPVTRSFGRTVFQTTAGTTYLIQLGRGASSSSASQGIRVEATPAPSASIFTNPFDPSSFDAIGFFASSFDPAGIGIDSWEWSFGDGGSASGQSVSHRYFADGDYEVTLVVGTPDGRTVTSTTTMQVRTHDIAVVKLVTPNNAAAGQTKTIAASIVNSRYPEMVRLDLYRSSPSGYVQVGSLMQSAPVRSGGRTTEFRINYTFTGDDASLGKVTFRAIATIVGARDALPADNEAIGPPTKVSR